MDNEAEKTEKCIERAIKDEKSASPEYIKMSKMRGLSPAERKKIRGIAADERKHRQILRSILGE